MHIVMFDIDGTITATTAVDSCCFVQAVADILNITDIDTNWASYRNVTIRALLQRLSKTGLVSRDR